MAMGRGKCMKVLFIAFLVIGLSSYIHALKTHIVGDSQGWGFSVSYSDWADESYFDEHSFLAVFNYPAGAHNVVPVDVAGYRSCKARATQVQKEASTGNDKFTLKKGANYFVCSFPGHCSAGMKIQANAN
ncbi:hypothetical protein HHK36_012901 [Tetracentron sinense]|uniref:Phytocyanin domain-containing protein n=1 Tax=Tetracentron sinense TaxID=13715 RepID=A0A834ZA63_TETSI|nr:hypothetical protein HHK36_012901 [Tetracentron sinense]